MPNRNLDEAAIKAGLNMDTFRSGWESQAKKEQLAQQHAQQQAAQQSAIDQATGLRELFGKEVPVSVSSEGASIGARDQGVADYRQQRMDLQRAEEERRVQNAKEDRLQKYLKSSQAGSATAVALQNLEDYSKSVQPKGSSGGILTNPQAHLETRSGLAGLIGKIPVIGQPLVKAAYPQETSRIQAVMNTLMKEDIGLNQTLSESERQIVGAALSPTASEDAVRAGMQILARKNAIRSQQNLAGLPKEGTERAEAFERGAFDPSKYSSISQGVIPGAPAQGTEATPPGFKKQVNKKTGQTRFIPIK